MTVQHGFLALLRNWFANLFATHKNKIPSQEKAHETHLEPKYWPEVKDFMETLHALIKSHTIQDDNIEIVNQRIVDYIAKQINIKGSLPNLEERYSALDTLADRILVTNLSKLVGLKHSDSTSADFSQAIQIFKKRLHERRQEEMRQVHDNH